MSIFTRAPDKEMRPDRPVPLGCGQAVVCCVARLDHIDIWPAPAALHTVRPGHTNRALYLR